MSSDPQAIALQEERVRQETLLLDALRREEEPSVSEAVSVIARYGEQFIFGDSKVRTFVLERQFDSGNAFTITVERDLARSSGGRNE